MESKRATDNIWFKLFIFVVGLLIGLGGAYVTTIAQVSTNTSELTHLKEKYNESLSLQKQQTNLMQTVVNQNSLLISKIAER